MITGKIFENYLPTTRDEFKSKHSIYFAELTIKLSNDMFVKFHKTQLESTASVPVEAGKMDAGNFSS